MDRDFKQYHRGEIYFANLNPAYGSEHGGIRPVLILQNDVGKGGLISVLLSGKLNDVLSGRLFYTDFGSPQVCRSL